MAPTMSRAFKAQIELIGINPHVLVPEGVLEFLFAEAGTTNGKIRVNMKIDGHLFSQTLVKYAGEWRLYLNKPMRTAAKKEVGDEAVFEIGFNPEKRAIPQTPDFTRALEENAEAKRVFEKLTPSMRLEIVRYIANLKSRESVDRNIGRAINFLLGKERFIGRDKPF